MLLITFHQGNDFGVYDDDGNPLTTTALKGSGHHKVTVDELRAMVVYDGHLWVANGAKGTSQVLCFDLPDASGSFGPPSVVISGTTDNGQFDTSIGHPFGIAFDDQGRCFVSNQDTNTVSLVTIHDLVGTMTPGSSSAYLDGLHLKLPLLSGTFVASQRGDLSDPATAPVGPAHGGLGAKPKRGKIKNSVRDVAIDQYLFVCDEVDEYVRVYSLEDGKYLGYGTVPGHSPTHLCFGAGGLFVSAGTSLMWAPLPWDVPNEPGEMATFQPVEIPIPELRDHAKQPVTPVTIGGISLVQQTSHGATTAVAYVALQTGTSGQNQGGAVYTYEVQAGSAGGPPAFVNRRHFVKDLPDTPEFVLYLPG
jgi:hypothetical protein